MTNAPPYQEQHISAARVLSNTRVREWMEERDAVGQVGEAVLDAVKDGLKAGLERGLVSLEAASGSQGLGEVGEGWDA